MSNKKIHPAMMSTKTGVIKTAKNTQKDNDDYDRLKVTPTELLSAASINERIKNFKRVTEDNLPNLGDGDRIRYFEVLDNGKFKYKSGGYLLVNGSPDYLVIATANRNWSVQLNNHIIFVADDIDKIEEEYRLQKDEFRRKETHLHKLLIKQKNLIGILRERIKELESDD
jgi:hypothetical protein